MSCVAPCAGPSQRRVATYSGAREFGLGLDAEPVRQAIVVVEERRHLNDVVNCRVVQPDLTQGLDIGLRHLAGCQGELAGIVEDGAVDTIERRAPVVRLDRLDQRVGLVQIANLFTEVQGVCLRSVEAVVGP